ncbi:hypothetical protein C2G38_2166640 [Gigaspora rosea]|uniref:Uncharacterized protein n=1 Tax=Gigaspora rosea TaxID=44941 RepID=A0A397VTC5_9GLOM|nr:hypothetical protein C2G38_2166640 [Gigaspora rosea]
MASPQGMFQAGIYYSEETGVEKAFIYYKKSADSGVKTMEIPIIGIKFLGRNHDNSDINTTLTTT